MKKLLIISLFIVSLVGLFAQGTPHLAIFHLETEAGGYHAPDAIGFKVTVFNPYTNAESWTGAGNFMYWNWPDGTGGENSAPTQYIDGNDPDTPGAIAIQMAPLENWGVMGIFTANFYFTDLNGHEVGPINLAKSAVASTTYPTVISWGGPAAPEFPSWATVVAPLDAATNVSIESPALEWAYEGVAVAGFEYFFNGTNMQDFNGDVFTFTGLETLNYATEYTWSIRPYSGTNEARVYPDPEGVPMPVWTFTTENAPIPELTWATLENPQLGEIDVAIENVYLDWFLDDETILPDGYEVYFMGALINDVTVSELTLVEPLDYATTYTWGVKPYREAAAPSRTGMRASKATRNPLRTYPEGDMPVWTFTTEAAPIELPSLANYSFPENNATGVALDAELGWGYQGAPIDGFEVYVDLATHMIEEDVAADVYNFAIPGLMYASEYSWSIRPYRLPETAKGMRAGSKNPVTRIYPEADVVVWSFTTTDEYDGGVAEIIPGTTVEVAVTVVLDGSTPPNFTPNLPIPIDAPTIELPAIAGAFNFGVTIDQTVPGTYTFTFTTDLLQGAIWLNGVKIFEGPFTGGVGTVTIYFDGAKAPKEIIFTESSLPVELASFTAVAHASQFVTLKWVTESESNLHGYNIYRAENASFNTAMRINPSVVVANNQAVTSTYTYTDNEVEAATYYYWLEVSELSNENTFHGPIVVTVEDEVVIPGVTATEFRNFGPSPFSETTSTSLRVKEGETASITIYNLLGQVVARESFNAGEHNFVFNGRDSNGKKVANGIYFVRMTSPTTAKNFKIIKMQ